MPRSLLFFVAAAVLLPRGSVRVRHDRDGRLVGVGGSGVAVCVAQDVIVDENDAVDDDERKGATVDDASHEDPEDDFYNEQDRVDVEALRRLSDGELEEICTSRGFDLVREFEEGAEEGEGSELEYGHEDYVNAAVECLKIEAELEEILEKHPEIIGDVRKESERMAAELDALVADAVEGDAEQQRDEGGAGEGANANADAGGVDADTEADVGDTDTPGGGGRDGAEDVADADNSSGIEGEDEDDARPPPTSTSTSTSTFASDPFGFREVGREVIRSMGADLTRAFDLVVPERFREPIKSAADDARRTAGRVGGDAIAKVRSLVFRYAKAITGGTVPTTTTGENDTNSIGGGEEGKEDGVAHGESVVDVCKEVCRSMKRDLKRMREPATKIAGVVGRAVKQVVQLAGQMAQLVG